MLRISDFSSLAQISVKALRYYDQIGLLSPASIDPQTGYRYYSAAQMSRLHRILALKDFGFTLEQIGEMLNGEVSAEQMRGMLLLRRAEQAKRVAEESDRLSRLTSRIRLIEQENQMNYDVITKAVPKQWIASVREIIPSYPAVGTLYGKVAAGLGTGMANSVMAVALWHDSEYKESNVDAEAGFYLREQVPGRDGVQVHELPEAMVASTVHNGSYQRLPEAYDALLRWVAGSSYHVTAPIRELYLYCPQPVRPDDETYVTEIQVPLEKNEEEKMI